MDHYSLRQVKIFKAIYEFGTTSRASKELGITQSGISRALGQLEKNLGFQLFIRRKNRIVKTPEATEFYQDIHRLISYLEEIDHNIAALREFGVSRVKFAAIPGLSFGFIPKVIACLMQAFESISIYFDIMSTNEIVRGVEAGKLDIGFVTLPIGSGVLEIDKIASTKAVCLLPQDHVLAKKKTIHLDDLLHQDLIITNKPNLSADYLLNLLEQNGIVTGRKIESNIGSICALVANKMGIAIINPITVRDLADQDKTVNRRFFPTIQYDFGLIYRKDWIEAKLIAAVKELIGRILIDIPVNN